MDSFHDMAAEKSSIENDRLFYDRLCEDPDAEVRLSACEALRYFPCEQTDNRLLKLLNDPDELVQCQACEALASSKSERALNALATACDNGGMLRGYAVMSLADVQRKINTAPDRIIALLLGLLDKEKDDWVRIAIYRSLIVLGIDKYMPDFLSHRKDADYHNRCLVLNLLDEMLSEGFCSRTDELRVMLLEMHKTEETLAVRMAIQHLLDDWLGNTE